MLSRFPTKFSAPLHQSLGPRSSFTQVCVEADENQGDDQNESWNDVPGLAWVWVLGVRASVGVWLT